MNSSTHWEHGCPNSTGMERLCSMTVPSWLLLTPFLSIFHNNQTHGHTGKQGGCMALKHVYSTLHVSPLYNLLVYSVFGSISILRVESTTFYRTINHAVLTTNGSKTGLKISKILSGVRHKPVIPAFGRLKQEDCHKGGQHGLHNEFKVHHYTDSVSKRQIS